MLILFINSLYGRGRHMPRPFTLTCWICCLSFRISGPLSSLKRSGVKISLFLKLEDLKSPFSRFSTEPAAPWSRCPLHLPPSSLLGEVAAVGVALPLGGAEHKAIRWAQPELKAPSHTVRCCANSLRKVFFISRSLFRASKASSNWLSEMSFRRSASSNWLLSRAVSSSRTLISCFRPSYSTWKNEE